MSRFTYVVLLAIVSVKVANAQGRPPQPISGEQKSIDVLSDTQGVDFNPYLRTVMKNIQENWYKRIPEEARPPIQRKGVVSAEFRVLKDGTIESIKLNETSGNEALDRGALEGIAASSPLPPLPDGFHGEYVALRFHFYYNPDASDLPNSRPASYTPEQLALRQKCAPYVNTNVEDLEHKRVSLPPHECAEVLAWM